MPPPLEEELTPPLDGCRLPLELDDDEDWLDDDDEVLELPALVDDPLEAVVEVEALPGMVAALIVANTPTAATAAAPAQKVRRCRRRSAASRASIRVVSTGVSVSNVAGLEMGTCWGIAERAIPHEIAQTCGIGRRNPHVMAETCGNRNAGKKLAPPEGIEPPTLTLGPSCSIH